MEKVCPRCKLPQEGSTECSYCGLIYADFKKQKIQKSPIWENNSIKKPNQHNMITLFVTIFIAIGFLYFYCQHESSKIIAEREKIRKQENIEQKRKVKELQLKKQREQQKAERVRKRVKKEKTIIKTYDMGSTVNIGYTSYSVWTAYWSQKISDNKYLDKKPDASWLYIQLSVRNDDKKPRNIPPFKLIDSTGAEHGTSSKAWRVEGNIGRLETLNPGVKKDGVLIFDVPRNRNYKLKISGGYWSAERALINIETNN